MLVFEGKVPMVSLDRFSLISFWNLVRGWQYGYNTTCKFCSGFGYQVRVIVLQVVEDQWLPMSRYAIDGYGLMEVRRESSPYSLGSSYTHILPEVSCALFLWTVARILDVLLVFSDVCMFYTVEQFQETHIFNISIVG